MVTTFILQIIPLCNKFRLAKLFIAVSHTIINIDIKTKRNLMKKTLFIFSHGIIIIRNNISIILCIFMIRKNVILNFKMEKTK